ncbi:ferrochelatase [Candidatus Coxiella mudrowiae]|uniref:ferrochelatase n=1 Tax=Candidatus Coxiella mudrowiae TaxID=2054173 RepID=UPI001FD15154|nr:ferrochelatase [Candidatus Coxiella mudrowiae]
MSGSNGVDAPLYRSLFSRISKKRIKKLVVICPSFVADCLETLEEIGIWANAQWKELGGGGELRLIPSLNSYPQWVKAVADMIRKQVITHV